MKKIILGLISLLTLCSCQKVSLKERTADSLMNRYSKELQKKEIYLAGSGGAMYDKITCLMLQYDKIERLDIEETRKLYMEALLGFIEKVDNCAEIQPFLKDHPFTYKNVEFGIGFFDKNHKFVPPPYIAYVSIIKGNILYSIYNEKNRLEVIYREPYEEAFKIVYGEK
jgi:hypothetical protein